MSNKLNLLILWIIKINKNEKDLVKLALVKGAIPPPAIQRVEALPTQLNALDPVHAHHGPIPTHVPINGGGTRALMPLRALFAQFRLGFVHRGKQGPQTYTPHLLPRHAFQKLYIAPLFSTQDFP